jgi:hypothetical protein
MTLRRRIIIPAFAVVAVAAGLGLVHEVSAGTKTSYPVVVDLRARTASGAIGAARNSPDFSQVIGCFVHAQAGVAALSLTCEARDANGATMMCARGDAALITASQAINGDSYVSVDWDGNGVCTCLTVWNSSVHEPKLP